VTPSSITMLRREAQVRALTTRHELGIPMASPVDVYSAVRQMRLWLLFEPLEGLFGMYQRQDEAAGMVVNVRVHPALQRYTAAHELGHHVMGHTAVLDPEDHIQRWSNLSNQELAAQMFAAEFLMPDAAVNTAALALGIGAHAVDEMGVYQLSLRLRTSYTAMINRLRTLGWYGATVAKRFQSVQPKELKLQLLGHPLTDPQADVWLVTDPQEATTIAPLVGDEVVFSFEEMPSTGFRWTPELPDGLDVEREEFVEPSDTDGEPRIGGPGRRHVYVSVREPQPSRARFELKMPWDAEEPPAATVDVAVQADLRPQPGVDAVQQPTLLAI
jgi:predicted secreted protein